MHADFSARPLRPDAWPDFETVMGRQGGCYGCWCTYFRLAAKERQDFSADERKHFMHRRVHGGSPPGLIGYVNGEPAGWVQVTPRFDVPRWNGKRMVSRPIAESDAEDENIWAISCFFLQSRFRGQGISRLLLKAALSYARAQGAQFVEACPIERAKHAKSVGLFVGSERIFSSEGFQPVACCKPGRPLMRLKFS